MFVCFVVPHRGLPGLKPNRVFLLLFGVGLLCVRIIAFRVVWVVCLSLLLFLFAVFVCWLLCWLFVLLCACVLLPFLCVMFLLFGSLSCLFVLFARIVASIAWSPTMLLFVMHMFVSVVVRVVFVCVVVLVVCFCLFSPDITVASRWQSSQPNAATMRAT